MKKVSALGLSLLLTVPGLSSAALAEGQNKPSQPGAKAVKQTAVLSSITLNDVISKGLANNKNLALLEAQAKNGQPQLQLQLDEAKEAIRLSLTAAYCNLLLQNDQIQSVKVAIQIAADEVTRVQHLYNAGRASKEDLRKAKDAKTKVDKQLASLEKSYQAALVELSLNIGIAYNRSIQLKGISYNIAPVNMPQDTTSLINNSFKMKRAQNDLETAIRERDDLYRRAAAGEAISADQLAAADQKVAAARVTITATKTDLKIAIKKLYHNADLAYADYQEAQRTCSETQADVKAAKARYQAGVISKYDYQKVQKQLTTAQINVNSTKLQHYLAVAAIKALQKGYVQ